MPKYYAPFVPEGDFSTWSYVWSKIHPGTAINLILLIMVTNLGQTLVIDMTDHDIIRFNPLGSRITHSDYNITEPDARDKRTSLLNKYKVFYGSTADTTLKVIREEEADELWTRDIDDDVFPDLNVHVDSIKSVVISPNGYYIAATWYELQDSPGDYYISLYRGG